MKSPEELIESRMDELNKEYERVLQMKQPENERCAFFENHKKRDLKIISGLISDYRRALRILKRDLELEV